MIHPSRFGGNILKFRMIHFDLGTPPKFYSSPLKKGGWMIFLPFLLRVSVTFQGRTVKLRHQPTIHTTTLTFGRARKAKVLNHKKARAKVLRKVAKVLQKVLLPKAKQKGKRCRVRCLVHGGSGVVVRSSLISVRGVLICGAEGRNRKDPQACDEKS